MKVLYSSY